MYCSCRAREALMLREDLMKSRQAERLAKQKLVEVTSSPDVFSVSTMLPDAARYATRA